jgi:4-hydroxyphenylpyruvate dioxygenase-like putative hemolysin
MSDKGAFALTRVDQIGIVVEDLEKSMEEYQESLRVGPFDLLDITSENSTIEGAVSPYHLMIALARNTPVQVELIQVVEGETIHSKFLREVGEGLHHVGMLIDDGIEEKIAELRERGINVLQRGEIFGRSHFAYMDTGKTSGVIWELIDRYGQRK